jgi:hypothetical protein
MGGFKVKKKVFLFPKRNVSFSEKKRFFLKRKLSFWKSGKKINDQKSSV